MARAETFKKIASRFNELCKQRRRKFEEKLPNKKTLSHRRRRRWSEGLGNNKHNFPSFPFHSTWINKEKQQKVEGEKALQVYRKWFFFRNVVFHPLCFVYTERCFESFDIHFDLPTSKVFVFWLMEEAHC